MRGSLLAHKVDSISAERRGQRITQVLPGVDVFVFDHLPPALALFMESEAGASMYEYALVAALATVVVIIVLIAVSLST